MNNPNNSWLRKITKYLKVLPLTLLLITANITYASIPPVKKEKKQVDTFVLVDTQPEFPGGETAVNKYLEESIIYPTVCVKNNIEGRVKVRFFINIDGSISDFMIVRGVHPMLDGEAIRVIARMPKWEPAIKYGNKIKDKTTLTVNFRLNKEKDANCNVVQKERVTASEKTLDEVFETVEKEPEFPGGIKAFLKYFVENVKYPDEWWSVDTHGRVLVNFIVHKDGSISNINLVKGIGTWQDEEAIRVIATMPKWIPGENKGKAVNVWHTYPIVFRLQQ